MRRLFLMCVALAGLTATGVADDLYKITLRNNAEAQWLKATNAEPLVWVGGGYLILADEEASGRIGSSDLDAKLIASGVSRDQLAMDGRKDDKNVGRYEVLYEEEGIRLFLIRAGGLSQGNMPPELFPLLAGNIEIQYIPKVVPTRVTSEPLDEISDLLDLVSMDTLWSYVEILQAWPGRVPGSANNLQAREWIYSKFVDYGYDSVYFDPFYQGCNVVACKLGSVDPDQQIVVGGHFDAVSVSPGADDNGSGTAATLEIARVLKDIDLPMTIIFIAFDAEETGLDGSYAYASAAYDRGDNIFYMQNMDMIGFITNTDSASLYYGSQTAFAQLWDEMGQTYVGIAGDFAGTSGRSDHYSFQRFGYDVCFCIEYRFSTVYHSSLDNTSYMSPDYFTRMTKATLATVYSASQMLPPVEIQLISQVGDGQSLQLTWDDVQCLDRDHYSIGYYPTGFPELVEYIDVPQTDTVWTVDDLTNGQEYGFFVQVWDTDGNGSLAFYQVHYGTPLAVPQQPDGLLAMPVKQGIRVTWYGNNTELDFDYYAIFRDGEYVDASADTFYVDDDPSLGDAFHLYKVAAVDTDGIQSDTVSMVAVEMKAAALQEDRILAVNRSGCCRGFDLVDEQETSEFLREALIGYDFDYYSDSSAVIFPFLEPQLDLIDMIDYGTMIVGMETGFFYDDLACDPDYNGILDTLAYYMSIGGKLIIFGRFGTVWNYDTVNYVTDYEDYNDAYHDYFHIDRRIQTLTSVGLPDTLYSDLIGATAVADDYPSLVWDSLVTLQHAQAGTFVVNHLTGIPCVSHVTFTPADVEVLYTYDSRDDDINNEGKPVAWRYMGDTYQYIYFDIPLSFFDRASAVAALRMAVSDLVDTNTLIPGDEPEGLPNGFALFQNYPNPFNPTTRIEYDLPHSAHVKLTIYNLLGQKVRVLVDEFQPAGRQFVEWDGRHDSDDRVASGLYFYRLQAGDIDRTKKMLLLK